MESVVHNFTRLLADLWDKIKHGSSSPTLSISEEDIVVFVVGPTGSGKSWFIKEATKSEFVKSDREHHPSTTKVQAIQCELTDDAKKDLQKEGVKSIVFVDTPSFLTGYDKFDAAKEIITWINRTGYRPRHLGMIYMHRIETDPMREPIQKHLQELASIPWIDSSHLPLRLRVVVSYDKTSGIVSDPTISKRVSSLCDQMKSLNSKTSKWLLSMHEVHFQGEPEVAWRAVEHLFRTDHDGPVCTPSNSTTYRWNQPFVAPQRVTTLGNDDIVVFVVGPSGAGKSLFVKEVTRSNLVEVGTNLLPCTAKVQAIKCRLTEEAKTALRATIQKNIVFVDTPSFHTYPDDGVTEKEMNRWLSESKSRSILAGTIYVHRVETDPYYESIQKYMNTFALTFPQNFVPLPERVHGVLSYEGATSQDIIRPRRQTFMAQLGGLCPSRLVPEGKQRSVRWITSPHIGLFKAGDSETAWQVVVDLFSPTRA